MGVGRHSRRALGRRCAWSDGWALGGGVNGTAARLAVRAAWLGAVAIAIVISCMRRSQRGRSRGQTRRLWRHHALGRRLALGGRSRRGSRRGRSRPWTWGWSGGLWRHNALGRRHAGRGPRLVRGRILGWRPARRWGGRRWGLPALSARIDGGLGAGERLGALRVLRPRTGDRLCPGRVAVIGGPNHGSAPSAYRFRRRPSDGLFCGATRQEQQSGCARQKQGNARGEAGMRPQASLGNGLPSNRAKAIAEAVARAQVHRSSPASVHNKTVLILLQLPGNCSHPAPPHPARLRLAAPLLVRGAKSARELPSI